MKKKNDGKKAVKLKNQHPTYQAIQVFLNNSHGKKIYVLDTNVLIADPDALFRFADNVVAIPDMVIEELDNHKKDVGDIGYNVRQAHRNLKILMGLGKISNGVVTDDNGLIILLPVSVLDSFVFPISWDMQKPDNIILAMAKAMQEEFSEEGIKAAIVSNDTNMQIKADEIGLIAEEYLHERVEEDYLSYSGREYLNVTNKQFQLFKQGQLDELQVADIVFKNHVSVKENMFVIVRDETTDGTLLGKVRNGRLDPLQYEHSDPFGVTPRNSGQRFAIEALMTPAEDIPLVILTGPAGTAKTYLTLACGLEKTAETHEYRRIVLSRANVEFDKDIGALPGTEEEKVNPLLRGAYDNLELLVDEKSVRKANRNDDQEYEISEKVRELFDHGYIRAEALGFLRGRSVTRQYVFIDEAQNTSISQMKGILTRAGDGTKIVISGDLDQIDNPKLNRHTNGLAYALKLMSGDPLCAVVGFNSKESTRSSLAAKVAEKIRLEK